MHCSRRPHSGAGVYQRAGGIVVGARSAGTGRSPRYSVCVHFTCRGLLKWTCPSVSDEKFHVDGHSVTAFLPADLATEETATKSRYFALLTPSCARDRSVPFPEKN